MRRRYFRWWSKFNFVLSAGLDAGTVLSGLFIFFTLQLPKGGSLCAFLSLSYAAQRLTRRARRRLVGEQRVQEDGGLGRGGLPRGS